MVNLWRWTKNPQFRYILYKKSTRILLNPSVQDPDPDPESVMLWASWIHIQIRNLFVRIRIRLCIRILLSPCTNIKKNLDFYCFVTSLWLFIFEEWCKCAFKKENAWKLGEKKNFLLAFQGHWRKEQNPHPDPYQNVTYPEHSAPPPSQGLQGDVVYVSWPIAPLVYKPNAGGAGSQPMRTAMHITWHGAQMNFGSVLRSRTRIHRIHVFFGLPDPDPDPLVRGMDQDPALDPDPSIIMQK